MPEAQKNIATVMPLYGISKISRETIQEQLLNLIEGAQYFADVRESARQLYSFAQKHCGSFHVFDRVRTEIEEPGGHHFHPRVPDELTEENPEACPRVLVFHATQCDIELDFFYVRVNQDGTQMAVSEKIEKHILQRGGVYLVAFGGEKARGHIAHDFRPFVRSREREKFERMPIDERKKMYHMIVFSSHPYDVATPENGDMKIAKESYKVDPAIIPKEVDVILTRSPHVKESVHEKTARLDDVDYLQSLIGRGDMHESSDLALRLKRLASKAQQAATWAEARAIEDFEDHLNEIGWSAGKA